MYTRIQYTYSQREGGRELNQREGERANRGEYRSQSWVENTNVTECMQEIGYLQSINSANTCREIPLLVNFFSMTDILQ